MSNTKDILNFYRAMGKKENLVPMYCVSSYPTKISEVNLKKIISLKRILKHLVFQTILKVLKPL